MKDSSSEHLSGAPSHTVLSGIAQPLMPALELQSAEELHAICLRKYEAVSPKSQ